MTTIIDSIRAEYRRYKSLAEAAIAQLSEEELSAPGPNGGNSVAIVCAHLSGNLRSRFTDFLTSDGEKPWRNREQEFEARAVTRTELLGVWEQGWNALFQALTALADEDLASPVTIRGERFTVYEALHRSLAHASYHVGQIVYLAKALRGRDWSYLSIPPGGSAAFNQRPRGQRPDDQAAALGRLPPRPDVIARRCAAFRRLHESGCFVMPNPWDAGSARLLAQLGFPAVASTSAGYAWSSGRADNQVPLEDALAHFRLLAESVEVPVNGDFEGGFAVEPEGVAANVRRAATTGIAGLSIEDSTGNAAAPLFEFALAVDRIRAARRAIDEAGAHVVLTARSEGFIVGRPDLAETVRRLTAYAEAGADCLYAPGIRTSEEIAAVVEAVAPKPVNALVGAPFITVRECADLGVRRISLGGALARAAWTSFLDAAREIAEHGTFTGLANAMAFADLNGRLGEGN